LPTIGASYQDFAQVADDQVTAMLARARAGDRFRPSARRL
jgi:predicted phosphoribosyltransferase